MADTIFQKFLADQYERGMALANNSDVLDLVAMPQQNEMPPQSYIAIFRCKSALSNEAGQIEIRESQYHVGISFRPDHLRQVQPERLATWLTPSNILHPNIRPPFICLGRVKAGITLVDILYQTFEIITYVNWSSNDPLDNDGAQWARNNQKRFPVERKPLIRRTPQPKRPGASNQDGESKS